MTTQQIAPLTSWSCDKCGGPVVADEDAENGGYVNWDEGVPPRLVHKVACQNDNLSSSAALSDFLGADGLAYLTSMMSYGAMRARHSTPTPPSHFDFPDHIDAFVDFFRRVQLPNYEEARAAMMTPEIWDEWNDANELAPYMQHNLTQIAAGT